jgi:hypothetical protein
VAVALDHLRLLPHTPALEALVTLAQGIASRSV